jgi:hypothetical protein
MESWHQRNQAREPPTTNSLVAPALSLAARVSGRIRQPRSLGYITITGVLVLSPSGVLRTPSPKAAAGSSKQTLLPAIITSYMPAVSPHDPAFFCDLHGYRPYLYPQKRRGLVIMLDSMTILAVLDSSLITGCGLFGVHEKMRLRRRLSGPCSVRRNGQ